MPDQERTPAITLAAIDPYAIPGWSSSDIVSPDRRTPAFAPPSLPGEDPEEAPPLDYDVRLVAYMDCVQGDALARGAAARFDDFCAMLLTLCPHGRLRSRQFQRGDDDGPLDLPVRLLVDMHCMAADADAELCDAFHDFYRGLLGLYPTAELFCRRYDMTASASKTPTGCAGEGKYSAPSLVVCGTHHQPTRGWICFPTKSGR